MDAPNTMEIMMLLLKVAHVTFIILVVSAVLGLLLGALLTMINVKNIPLLKQFTVVISSFTRSVPIIIQLFIVYYALPPLLANFGINVSNMSATVAAILALTLYHGGYLTEVLRAAYKAVDKGQHEAADSLGYTPATKFFRIILPQVVPVALPGWGNALIHLIHDTSLVFALGVADIMGRAELIAAASFGVNQVQIFIIVAVIYIVVTFLSDGMVRLLEKKTRKYKLDSGLNARGI
ncbi:amino acid ABC transporter permease [Planococcus sp. N064]|uniref:Amino acid ABC transporter permease n=1 Tax=Planococcus liqunii TaxID=3058394 RepID=A0ABT8MSG1_9BACL|nr:amino acid ABC transporter permease [Planococcus sp. N064]MDN7227857.1 amino acid ABC transporter permease [Planococcus sp. N064]